jgi:hypothetical protein
MTTSSRTGSANGVLGTRKKCADFYLAPQCLFGPYEYGPGRLDY